MKRIILLIGIVFCICNMMYAQKFEANTYDNGDAYEIRIKHFNKLYAERFTKEKVAKPKDENVVQREEWRDSCAAELLTLELREILQEVAKEDGGGFWVTFYCDSDGKVQTVTFMMSSSVYVKLPNKMLQEIFRRAMEIALNPACYAFDGIHDYAIDVIELMKCVV